MTQGILNKGLFIGILIGVLVGAGFAVRGAWTDPTQAPPNGVGRIRVPTGTQVAADCNEASEYGRLEYNATSDDVRLCTDGNAWVDIGP
jgi:hypothetical protein